MQFTPNETEAKLIRIIQKYNRNEYALIRITPTMLKKSIIDASQTIKRLLKSDCNIDYDSIERGKKYLDKAILVTQYGIDEKRASFYHPKAKTHKTKGDPRFWIYRLNSYTESNTLFYFTSYQHTLVCVALTGYYDFEKNIISIFGDNHADIDLINELLSKVSHIRSEGWIESVAPNRLVGNTLKSAPKDAGDTFERKLNINPNSFKDADYEGEIELKTKRLSAKNNDTLFSKVPNWSLSNVKSSKEMILTYGYPSNKEKYSGYRDLYVTVKHKANNQGLYLVADDENSILTQFHKSDDIITNTAIWLYDDLKNTLYTKHKKTLWVNVDERIINNKIYFKYISAELTQKPIFTQFTSLINQSIVVYDWRGRVMADGTKYKDKGHAFRMHNRSRYLLFGESKVVDFDNY